MISILLVILVLALGWSGKAALIVVDKEYPYWARPVAARLVALAALLCPPSTRGQRREEWLAELDWLSEIQGHAGLLFALGTLRAGPALAAGAAARSLARIRDRALVAGANVAASSSLQHPFRDRRSRRAAEVTLAGSIALSVIVAPGLIRGH